MIDSARNKDTTATPVVDPEPGISNDAENDSSPLHRAESNDVPDQLQPPEATTEKESISFQTAIWALRFAILADAINSQVLGPNYALLVLEGGSPDSFPSTAPFGFSGAYYFLPMSGDIGMVLSALCFGYLSDKIGRKMCILICMYLGGVGSVLKFLARNNFWTFCAANFATGLVGGSLAVGMAYVSDVTQDRTQKDAEIGILIATSLIGRTGGGIVSIAMKSVGLFAPLWVAAGVSVLAGVVCQVWMVHSDPKLDGGNGAANQLDETFDPSASAAKASCSGENVDGANLMEPEELDRWALCNVLAGELTDNLGSIGLVPMCISPLMFNTFYASFVEQGLDPIMSDSAYKWIYVFIAVLVVPGAIVAPSLFQRFGPAICAVVANILTGAVTIALLHIANANPTVATFAIFVSVLYMAFPFTVISQLSTGPMLDRIAPVSQRGQIQGYNMAAMNLAGAIGPFLLGNLTDATSIDVCLYTAAGISLLAAAINYLLTRDARFGPEAMLLSDTTLPSRFSISTTHLPVAPFQSGPLQSTSFRASIRLSAIRKSRLSRPAIALDTIPASHELHA